MLKKELRVKKENDFNKIYRKGNYVGGPLFNVNFLFTRAEATRVGVVVSKKTAKKAVDRNKMKRQVREAVKDVYPNLKSGFDIVINIKKEVAGKKRDALKAEFSKQLNKKGLLK